MRYIVTVALIIAGIINLLPIAGILGADQLVQLYGITITDPNLVILMRHRAVLFGLLGLFSLYAAFKTSLQVLAITASLISLISFVVLAWSSHSYNMQIGRVIIADLIAIGSLVIGIVAYYLAKQRV